MLNRGLNTCLVFSKNIEEYITDVEIAFYDQEKMLMWNKCKSVLNKVKNVKNLNDTYIKILGNIKGKGVIRK